jgi:hypothetical protein
MKRPPAGPERDINLGQFDDVTSPWMGGTYNNVYEKSAFCSGCHQYSNLNGVIVDDTYDSWVQSQQAQAGIQCQDCHTKPNADSIFVSGIGLVDAVPRDPQRIYNHFFRGTTSEFLDRSAGLAVTAEIYDDTLQISAAVTNRGAGHKLPTGVSFRNMLLVISALRGTNMLAQISGETIPHFGGVGEAAQGNYAASPGKAFALVTRNGNTGEWPAPNWQATEIFYDSRIPANHTDSSEYRFLIPGSGQLDISARLLYRAVYKSWADAKGWDLREYLMADTAFTLQVTAIAEIEKSLPETVVLHPNFPNPFNGTTLISYELPAAVFVNLAVYNIRGQKIATLVNRPAQPGQHQTQWDGKNHAGEEAPSGVYFYRLSAGSFVKSHKMLLVR